jgi:predicted extracellular nuclease
MATIRLGTFNCENLFARYKFNSNVDPATATQQGFDVNMTKFTILNETEKELTAKAISALDADVLAVQEIENLDVLKRFRKDRLKNKGYTHVILVDGNDPRQIDVAVLSRFPIVRARSYQHLKDGSVFLFSRDCLEVDIQVNGSIFTLYVNHLKSMLDKNNPSQGRKNTRPKRVKQAKGVMDIVKARFGANPGGQNWAVLGDLNDFQAAGQGTTSGITDLVTWSQLENVVDRLPAQERWTHFFGGAPAGENKFNQLDYILLSSSLAGATNAAPVIERRGLPPKATLAGTARFQGVTNTNIASDHCPVAIDINV